VQLEPIVIYNQSMKIFALSALAVVLLGCGGSGGDSTGSTVTTSNTNYVGTWTGQWWLAPIVVNPPANSHGTVTLQIDSANNVTGTCTADDGEQGTFTGSATPTGYFNMEFFFGQGLSSTEGTVIGQTNWLHGAGVAPYSAYGGDLYTGTVKMVIGMGN